MIARHKSLRSNQSEWMAASAVAITGKRAVVCLLGQSHYFERERVKEGLSVKLEPCWPTRPDTTEHAWPAVLTHDTAFSPSRRWRLFSLLAWRLNSLLFIGVVY